MYYGGMKTQTDLIDAFGGSTELAKALGCPPPTVAAWKHRGIPATWFLDIVTEAKVRRIKGVSLESLHRLDPPKRGKHKAGAA